MGVRWGQERPMGEMEKWMHRWELLIHRTARRCGLTLCRSRGLWGVAVVCKVEDPCLLLNRWSLCNNIRL